MRVEVTRLNEPVGTIAWEGRWVLDPPDSPTLQRMLQEEIMDVERGGKVTAKDPERYLQNLCYHFRTPYLWATPPQEASPPAAHWQVTTA